MWRVPRRVVSKDKDQQAYEGLEELWIVIMTKTNVLIHSYSYFESLASLNCMGKTSL